MGGGGPAAGGEGCGGRWRGAAMASVNEWLVEKGYGPYVWAFASQGFEGPKCMAELQELSPVRITLVFPAPPPCSLPHRIPPSSSPHLIPPPCLRAVVLFALLHPLSLSH